MTAPIIDFDWLFSVESERILLGNLLENPDLLAVLNDIGIEAPDFSNETHGRIWDGISAMRRLEIPVDTFGLFEHLAWIIHEVSSQKRKDALKGLMNTGFRHPAFPFGASIA